MLNMKQFLKYTMISLLAGLIFYGGAGVNWVTYCCDDCFEIGIQAAVSESCCETHTHDQLTLNGLHNCGIERVEFEWTSFENERSLIILPFITDGLYNLSYTYLLTDSELLADGFIEEDDPASVLPPREYLALLTTLLI